MLIQWQARAPLTSEKFNRISIDLTLRKMITFIGKKEVKIEVDVRRGHVK